MCDSLLILSNLIINNFYDPFFLYIFLFSFFLAWTLDLKKKFDLQRSSNHFYHVTCKWKKLVVAEKERKEILEKVDMLCKQDAATVHV